MICITNDFEHVGELLVLRKFTEMETLVKRLLLHPQRTLDLEYQGGGDDLKI